MHSRRSLLVSISAFMAWPALADDTPAFLEAYERATGGRAGVYARNLHSGAELSWRAQERFVMCSTFKASLAALVLARVDRGHEYLGHRIAFGPEDVPDWYAPVAREHLAQGALSVEAMCAAAVEYSDNTCANLLLARVGGPDALTSFWRSMGDPVTRLDHNEPLLNRSPPGDPHDTTTPMAMAGNLRRLLLGNTLSRNSRGRLTDWMLNCKTGDNRLRGGLPPDWRIADKTGNNGTDAAGDIAIVWSRPGVPILLCAYVQGGSPTAEQVTGLFADIGRHVGRQLA